MTIHNTAQKGARFERTLLNLAISKGATLAMRGASSKSRSTIQNLKIDLIIIKGRKIYLIQAKKSTQDQQAQRKRIGSMMQWKGLDCRIPSLWSRVSS
jgi:Holliday junction resolvase